MIKEITATENGFCMEYGNTLNVRSIEGDYSNASIKVNFRDGSFTKLNLEVLTPYQEQFGILLSADEKCVFIQDWDEGVFCYNIQNKSLIWRNKKKIEISLLIIKAKLIVFIHLSL